MATKISQGFKSLQKSDFTIVNQGTRSVIDGYGSISIYGNTSGTFELIYLLNNIPSGKYSLTAKFNTIYTTAGNRPGIHGLCWEQLSSGNNKTHLFGVSQTATVSPQNLEWSTIITGVKSGSKTDAGNQYYQTTINIIPSWLRIKYDGTNRISYYSQDGLIWYQAHSISNTDYITPSRVGIFVSFAGGTNYLAKNIVHYNFDYTDG